MKSDWIMCAGVLVLLALWTWFWPVDEWKRQNAERGSYVFPGQTSQQLRGRVPRSHQGGTW